MTTKKSLKTVKETLSESSEYLESKGIAHPRRSSEEMLSAVLSLSRMELYLHFDQPLNAQELDKCRLFLRRLTGFEPVQYILGEVSFYNCSIKVDPRVLIPRPETEILVDRLVKELKEVEGAVVLDLCTGSGCIGIALKKALPHVHVICSDLSQEALSVAESNAELNGAEIEFLHGDLFSPLEGRTVDAIISNPPYVSQAEYERLSREVKNFEPEKALVADEEGLGFYRRIAEGYRCFLRPGGKLRLEIGSGQGEAVCRLFGGKGRVEADWSGHDRFFSLENE